MSRRQLLAGLSAFVERLVAGIDAEHPHVIIPARHPRATIGITPLRLRAGWISSDRKPAAEPRDDLSGFFRSAKLDLGRVRRAPCVGLDQLRQPPLPLYAGRSGLGNDPLPACLPVLADDELADAKQALDVYRAAPKTSSARAVDRVMAKLVVAYPAARVSEAEAGARLDVYAEQLSDIPADVLMAGAMAAARTIKFFPSIAEIRAAAMSQGPDQRQRV